METPLQITFRHMTPVPALEELIRAQAAKLEEFFNKITGCHVTVEMPHRHHQHGNVYQVRIDVIVPGSEIVVNREPGMAAQHRDAESAVHDAFATAGRLLEDYVRRLRGDIKYREGMQHGRVVRLFPNEGCGFLETGDGRELYFHRHSVLRDAFAQLQLGDEVAFAEEQGQKGPQASTVRPVGRHGHA
jgi:cold shock CspA family protein/ribosome-associated translation inhibitor RaiA